MIWLAPTCATRWRSASGVNTRASKCSWLRYSVGFFFSLISALQAPLGATKQAWSERGENLQPREAVERALEDQVLQGDRGIERVTDGVREPAIALEALRELRRALRVDEQHRAEFFGLCPDGMEFRIGKLLARDAAADGGSAQAELLHGVFELLRGEVGILQGERSKGGEALRLRRAQLGELLVLQLDDRRRGVTVLAIPERIDGKHFHVDRHGVHLSEALGDDDVLVLGAVNRDEDAPRLFAHQVDRIVKQAVRVNVDRLDPSAIDGDREARRTLLLGTGRIEHPAAAEGDAGRCAGAFEEASPGGHRSSPRFPYFAVPPDR